MIFRLAIRSTHLPFIFRALCLVTTITMLGFVFLQKAKANETAPQLLNIGISFSIPPWVIKDNNSGIELDLLYAALDSQKYIVKPNYVPFAQAFKLFDAGRLDGVINAKAGVTQSGFLSDPVVTFQNVAVSLRKKGYPEDISMDFLQNKFVVAFQKARQLLGEEFASMANINTGYQEIAKQSLQINLLFIRETDFIVLDKSIFGYYWDQAVHSQTNPEIRARYFQPVRFHYLFEPTVYHFIFKEERIRDAFNTGLKTLKQNGKYEAIFKKYDNLTDLYERAQAYDEANTTLSPSS